MYAVEKLGSYITRGVYTVSGPFHPFGGAVDIIVVQQQDGSYKSSPWYVRFGKFQGVLKAKEKVVRIGVNDNDAGFHMYLDNKGEAYFLIDAEATDGESVMLSPPTSGDESVVKIESPRFKKAKSCREPIEQVDAGDGKIVEQTYSKRSGLLGLMFGRRSMKENGINQNGQLTTSMERAEFAADLLETNWSTNLSAKNSKTGSSVGVDVAVKEGGLEMPASTSNNVSSSTLTSSHFEELIVEDSPSRGDDEEILSSNTSTELIDMTKDQITLGADDSDVTLNNSGHRKPISGYTTPFFNCDGSLEESVDDNDEKPGDNLVSGKMYENSRKEKIIRTPCVRSQEEVMEITPLETVSSTGRSEMIFELSLSESDGFHVPSEGPSSSSGSSGGQSPTLAVASCDSDNSTKESDGASFFHGSKAGNGETEVMPVSYCQTAESRNTRFHASTIEAEEVLHLSPGSDEKSERHYEVLYGRSELILEVKSEPENDECRENLDGGQHQNLEVSAVDFYSLSESPQVDQPVDRSLDTKIFHESPQTDSVSPNLSGSHSSLQGNLIHYESEVMYQDKGNVKSDQDKEMNTEQAEVLVNQIGSSELGVVETSESAQPLHSFGNSESHNTWGFSNSLSSSDHVEEGVDVDEALKPESSWLSDEVEIAQEAVDPTSMGAVKGRAPSSDILEEDQFLFSDIENSEAEGIDHEQSQKDTTDEMDDHHSHIVLADIEEGMKDTNDEHSSGKFSKAPRTRTRPLNIPRPRPQLDETKLSVRSLPIIYSRVHDFEGSNLLHPLSCSLNLSSEKDEQVSLESQISSPSKLEANSESSVNIYISKYADTAVDSEKWAEQNNASTHPSFGMVGVDQAGHNLEEDASVPLVPSGGSWNLWPFSRKPKTAITVCSSTESIVVKDVETASTHSRSPRRNNDTEEDQIAKKKVRSLTPTSEELASLNLNEGSNTITFTFSTAMLGAQQVDARIYLWKWNTRVVISDVDGTITKSDVLGQFMPLVGKDWSHTGVTHLFSAIKENGYQLLFLSARSISQAYITRQFLFNLKQDGKALPDGPVVISPDGLFPSLYREVIRRAPHEFKISTLEVIKALFPPDCNPFYAGFGNRDTDEISYLKVGIPKGKIFIINPKGEVAVNRQIDTKSYTSLHALVNGMFPPMSSAEQEDYNSWNYWKLPPIFDVDT